jgi:transcription elongation factor GreA
MGDETFTLTPAGYKLLQSELQRLQEKVEDVRDKLADINENLGDMEGQESGAMIETQITLDHIHERMGHIQFVLERAQVREEDVNPKQVDPGERVVVWDFIEKRERTFDILSSPEARMTYDMDDGGANVSTESPVGKAFVGRQIGDVVEIEVPDGVARYAIRRIEDIPV